MLGFVPLGQLPLGQPAAVPAVVTVGASISGGTFSKGRADAANESTAPSRSEAGTGADDAAAAETQPPGETTSADPAEQQPPTSRRGLGRRKTRSRRGA